MGGLLALIDIITPILLTNIIMAGVCLFYMFGLPRVDREKEIRANGVVGKRESSSFRDFVSLLRFLLRDKLSLVALLLYFLGTIGSQDVMDVRCEFALISAAQRNFSDPIWFSRRFCYFTLSFVPDGNRVGSWVSWLSVQVFRLYFFKLLLLRGC